MTTTLFYWYGWIFVRPRRWLFWKMIAKGSFGIRWIPEKSEYWTPELDEFYEKYRWPNLHWWLLYKTIFKFCKWLHYDGWRPFCDWTGGHRRSFPWIARAIKRIGDTTSGYAIGGGECPHCASTEGSQGELSEDETGTTFILEESWSVGTQDGTFTYTKVNDKLAWSRFRKLLDHYHDTKIIQSWKGLRHAKKQCNSFIWSN